MAHLQLRAPRLQLHTPTRKLTLNYSKDKTAFGCYLVKHCAFWNETDTHFISHFTSHKFFSHLPPHFSSSAFSPSPSTKLLRYWERKVRTFHFLILYRVNLHFTYIASLYCLVVLKMSITVVGCVWISNKMIILKVSFENKISLRSYLVIPQKYAWK